MHRTTLLLSYDTQTLSSTTELLQPDIPYQKTDDHRAHREIPLNFDRLHVSVVILVIIFIDIRRA